MFSCSQLHTSASSFLGQFMAFMHCYVH
uniref:Uncharacterized protein n=1 Tax=Anguilla anguilla TaxID=7936 RepID=A0A0E9PW98_ANGAN